MLEALGWTRNQLSFVAEVSENCVWNALTVQGGGDLHVFTPYGHDPGLDGIVHRLSDGAYVDVQVKGRSELWEGEVRLVVWADSLNCDNALMVIVHLDGERLAPWCAVCTESEFKRRAHLGSGDGRPAYTASISLRPEAGGRWADLVVATEALAARFSASPAPPALGVAEPPSRGDPRWVGTLGETEVLRRLVEERSLAIFRPRTDLETVELVLRGLDAPAHLGLQVKTAGVDQGAEGEVDVRLSSFRPHPSTWVVALGWLRAERRFHEEMLLIPSADLGSLLHVDGNHGMFGWTPGSRAGSRLDPYRHPLAALGELVAKHLSAAPAPPPAG